MDRPGQSALLWQRQVLQKGDGKEAVKGVGSFRAGELRRVPVAPQGKEEGEQPPSEDAQAVQCRHALHLHHRVARSRGECGEDRLTHLAGQLWRHHPCSSSERVRALPWARRA